ncbi:MAG: hypothetical protein ACI936_001186 [Paraglaciecola sp.]|jgi:hypothetical protein
MGLAIAVHRDVCITFHVHDALSEVAGKQDTLETRRSHFNRC